MTRADRLALLLSFLAVLVAYLVADRVFERMPHIEDEVAYVWQATAIAKGYLTLPTPPAPKSFLVPFVVDYNGQRFGKYPLGWPALMAAGVFLGGRSLVNPLLAGLGVWLTYRLGKRTFGETVGLLAAALTITSPFFMMNSGSLLAHPFGLVLSAAFALFWLDAWDATGTGFVRIPGGISISRRWPSTLAAALSLGLLAITRPFTAIAVSLPFGLHGMYLLIRGVGNTVSRSDASSRWKTRRRLLVFGAIVLAFVSIHFIWQYAVTGDPLLNPYTLWWPYDKVGLGPGYGHTEAGHNLNQAWVNTRFSLLVGSYDLFGWGYSWIFLPFGLLAVIRKPRALLLASVFPSLVLVYLFYWIGSSLFGPRYFYEGLYSLTLLSAAGIAFLAGWPTSPGMPWRTYSGWRRTRPLFVTAILALLVSANLLFYIPIRVGGMQGLFGLSRSRLEPFLTREAQELAPALITVHAKKWTEYGSFLELQDPLLDTPFIFVISWRNEKNATLAESFPQRTIYHYYPDQPYKLYTAPRPEP